MNFYPSQPNDSSTIAPGSTGSGHYSRRYQPLSASTLLLASSPQSRNNATAICDENSSNMSSSFADFDFAKDELSESSSIFDHENSLRRESKLRMGKHDDSDDHNSQTEMKQNSTNTQQHNKKGVDNIKLDNGDNEEEDYLPLKLTVDEKSNEIIDVVPMAASPEAITLERISFTSAAESKSTTHNRLDDTKNA
jgi:hypothetical protein